MPLPSGNARKGRARKNVSPGGGYGDADELPSPEGKSNYEKYDCMAVACSPFSSI